jgi:pimeloyl-ACP methyl ester carboxylesterase
MTALTTHCEQLREINGVDLCVETFGDRADPPILLVAGGSASMLWWDTELCERIAAGGRYVVRYDHRDTGRSTGYPPGELERDVARARDYASTLVNHYAVEADRPTRGGFGDIAAPTLVVHGDRDPVLPFPHGEALRDAIPGAELLVLDGAGHDLPRPGWDAFVPALIRHTGRGRS